MKHNILVTGSDGFIGSNLCNRLKLDGHYVTGFDQRDGDISSCKLDYPGIDHVFHLAAKTFVPESWTDPRSFYQTNVLGTLNVLEFCRSNKCGITFISSYVYGIPKYLPVDEKHPLCANTPYNHSKLMGEDLAKFYSEKFGIKTTIFRPFNIYGPGQHIRFLIPSIIAQAIDPKCEVVEVMDLAPRRDYLFIDDLISALILSMDSRVSGTYNLGLGRSYSVEEIIKLVLTIAGSDKGYLSKGKPRQDEVMDVVANKEKATAELGWAPNTPFRDGIERTCSYASTHITKGI